MEAFLVFALILVLILRWWVLAQRYGEIERRLDLFERERIDPKEITRLIKRITHLEELVKAPSTPPEPKVVLAPIPVIAPEPPKPEPKREPIPEHSPRPVPEPLAAPPAPPSLPGRPVAPAALVSAEPARPSRTSAEWEALVGGNWLNKVGVLVLVVALALFLGYEFPRLGPAGISMISLAISFTLLIGGVLLERRAPYVIFGRGLLAGGWAGLYFTTYAMQSLDAARVIHNAALGAVLLLAIATGMVVHSLRYREQALTGLAYFMAFFTLAITQVTALSVIALIPLAGSLLVIAYRFEWKTMALFGMAATYATCASKPDTGAPLWQAQAVFAAYWLLFEAYDLRRSHRRSNHLAEQAVLPFNALGFAMLSYAKWDKAAPDSLYQLTIGIATAYLASTVLRAILRPPVSFSAETGTFERILAGGFEGPITLAAAASAAAAVLKLQGQTVNNVLLAEGEVLFLAGLIFRQDYPRRLAAAVFGALGIKLFAGDIPHAGTVTVAGRTLEDWTPSTAMAALLFYVNRALRKAGVSYGYFASALVALILGFEVPLRQVGVAWLGLSAVIFLLGWRRRLLDFRVQGYLGGLLAVGGIAFYQFSILQGAATPAPHPWIPLACAAAIAYAAALCAVFSRERFAEAEAEQLRFTASAVACVAAATLLWKVVPAADLGPAWMALALVVLELGLHQWPAEFRWQAHVLGAFGAGRVIVATILPFHAITEPADRIAIAAAATLAYSYAARARASERRAFDAASACGSFLLMVELWALLDPVLVAPVWALFALLLTTLGFTLNIASLRVEGHAVSLAALGRIFAVNLDAAHRIPAAGVVIAAHYFESWRHGRMRERLATWERSLDRPYLYTAALLMASLLYKELQPPLVEVGWAAFALVLLAVGRGIDQRDLCDQSYGLAALAFGRALEMEFTSPRALPTAAVAGCLFAAQFQLTRERLSRLYYSLLATALATALLYQEVSGSMLTVAWGIEGAALLGLGFPLRDRTLRLSGLTLFLLCVGKLFLYDLRELETIYRILSFFVLGVILVGVSWLYTRFRDQIQRYL